MLCSRQWQIRLLSINIGGVRELLPPDYQQELFKQYQDCRQGTRIVNEYMEEFDRLANRNDLEEIEDQRISRFLHGLQVSIRD